jgi:hypothetical protein
MRRDELDKLIFNNVIDEGSRIRVNFYGSKAVGHKQLNFAYVVDPTMINYIRLYMSKFKYQVCSIF